MANIESRPFLTPHPTAVSAVVELRSPNVEFARLHEIWRPGDDLEIRGTATLSDDFWADTAIPMSDEIWLAGVAVCAPARTSTREYSRFELIDGAWVAQVDLAIDGSEIAVELNVDLWVVGPGRTGLGETTPPLHQGAKLWQLEAPVTLSLERETADFPTTAISFSATGRLAVPWSVDAVVDAEPHWSISSAVRLYVNTDTESHVRIVDGTASESVFAAIGCDIHIAVLHRLGAWRDLMTAVQMQAIAEDDLGSLAALGANIAISLGLSFDEACRLAIEDPITLGHRSRESLSYFADVSAK